MSKPRAATYQENKKIMAQFMWLQRKDRKDLLKFSSNVFKTHTEKVSTVNLNICKNKAWKH